MKRFTTSLLLAEPVSDVVCTADHQFSRRKKARLQLSMSRKARSPFSWPLPERSVQMVQIRHKTSDCRTDCCSTRFATGTR